MNKLKLVKCGCGGDAEIHIMGHEMNDAQYYVNCENCGTRTWFFDSEAKAITAWNRAMGEQIVKVEQIPDENGTIWNVCKCGTDVYRAWIYCPYCGARLEWE